MNQPITSFAGVHAFLSNFQVSQIAMAGRPTELAMTVEHAFQAEKMVSEADRAAVLRCSTPGRAKKLARTLQRRADWEQIKTDVMKWYVTEKFRTKPVLLNMLRATGDRYLIEGNNWNDRCWGAVFENGQWVGENRLGLILMDVRCALTR
jgi:ribA/ribD-fused uncharacterized protein